MPILNYTTSISSEKTVTEMAYKDLWDSINAKLEGGRKTHNSEHTQQRKSYAWASNPWVWVIEFRRLQP